MPLVPASITIAEGNSTGTFDVDTEAVPSRYGRVPEDAVRRRDFVVAFVALHW